MDRAPATGAGAGRARPRNDSPESRRRRCRRQRRRSRGEGWHERAGGPHAEVVALEAAGERARGSTLYVTMEPCAHHGRTPPCVDAVLAAGVSRVVAGSLDPGEDSGGGLEQLRAAGLEVRARRRLRSQGAERGVAHVDDRAPSVRDLQGGGHARRTRDGARVALGERRGQPPPRARAARERGCRRGRHGHRPRRRSSPGRPRCRCSAAAAAARFR